MKTLGDMLVTMQQTTSQLAGYFAEENSKFVVADFYARSRAEKNEKTLHVTYF